MLNHRTRHQSVGRCDWQVFLLLLVVTVVALNEESWFWPLVLTVRTQFLVKEEQIRAMSTVCVKYNKL